MATIHIDQKDLEDVVTRVVHEVVRKIRLPLRYKYREAADMLGLNEKQLHDERKRGRIRGYLGIRDMWFYRLEDVQAYAERNPSKRPQARLGLASEPRDSDTAAAFFFTFAKKGTSDARTNSPPR